MQDGLLFANGEPVLEPTELLEGDTLVVGSERVLQLCRAGGHAAASAGTSAGTSAGAGAGAGLGVGSAAESAGTAASLRTAAAVSLQGASPLLPPTAPE